MDLKPPLRVLYTLSSVKQDEPVPVGFTLPGFIGLHTLASVKQYETCPLLSLVAVVDVRCSRVMFVFLAVCLCMHTCMHTFMHAYAWMDGWRRRSACLSVCLHACMQLEHLVAIPLAL